MAKARLLIVDDHALMCQGLRAILEPEYAVVGIVHDGESVLPAARQLKPDVVLLDLSLPGRTGAEVLHELMTGTTAPPGIVVLTMHVERALADHMIALGARAFVPKDARLAELRTAIDAARTGQRYISPRVPPHLEPDAYRYPRGYHQLTSRERQIVRMIGAGLTSDRIADELRISYHTVHFHRTNIRRKLGFHSDYEMSRFALMVLQGDSPEQSERQAGTRVRPAV
ncbi:MAG TPA: response regulator transcription factor [Gemmatimonadales bacterium]|nr:response regulator transcription factor [Gemmatimonadales bacterium]